MDKYEYRVKTEQMLEYLEKKQYKKAMEIADTIDWRRVKNASMLGSVSEIYEFNGEFQKSRDILFLAYDRAPGSRKVVYRLGTLALKINDIEESTDCYEEFIKIAPKDPNQYILKYKILKARQASIDEQIEALEDFKKAEYVEKWAYELAKLYHEAGMTVECLEECDDLILWFSEGKYVYQAMELKMKYKPLTPLQQEKYNNRIGNEKRPTGRKTLAEDNPVIQPIEKDEDENLEMPEKKEPEMAEAQAEESGIQDNVQAGDIVAEFMEGEMSDKPETEALKVRGDSPIRKTVKGATLAEALANGVAVANGLNLEEKGSTKRDEDMRITGQMKIEEILQEWESKQKVNAEAIETQKQKDEEIAARKRREAEKRREEEARRIEEQQRAAEEARRIAEQKAAEEARRQEEARKEEERRLAEEKAAEERRLEAEKEAEEERILEKLASGKEAEAQPLSADIRKLMEELEGSVSHEEEPEEEEDFDVEENLQVVKEAVAKRSEAAEEKASGEDTADEDEYEVDEEYEIEAPVREEAFDEEDDFGEESDYVEADEEDDFEEDDFEEDGFEEDDYEEGSFEEDDFDEEEYDEEDYEEDDYEESDFEEPDYDEDDFDGEDYEEDDFEDEEDEEDEGFLDDDLDLESAVSSVKSGNSLKEELVIEEPTEEEIQDRIKKGKPGVPFDTGFVVTGRYDLSATSEIGLKAGLTEEQKKLFSYFVPVRGMSEQIVEVLDNDRREQREGTSRTGNLLVIGRKGSGKTVLAVDIVKAIQKQRNLKQGKVAIVTGESLNKKELSNIIQKLRGGAIIVEKAGKLNSSTVDELNFLMEKKTGELLFVLEDQRKPLERLFTANPDFKKKFTSKLELPVFINDELVTFGQTYAKENGYKLDEMGILALYSRIDVMQREDHAVTVAEVKEIMDDAIEHSQKANVKHLARRVFGKGTDSSDRIILKEEDFRS